MRSPTTRKAAALGRAGGGAERRGSQRHWARRAAYAAVLLSAAACAPGGSPPSEGPAGQREPIINGTSETGYLGVGALVYDDDSGVWGNFCTGTLIDDEWVLTAAHCTEQEDLRAWMVSFFVGSDATDPSYGDQYAADSFHAHWGYDPETHDNDIALVHLMEPATGVPTYAYNTEVPWDGLAVTWVGFGINDVSPDSGSGIKRRGTGSIADVYMNQILYYTGTGGALPCRGDSGGPTFGDLGSGQRIVGVIAAGDETCSENGIDSRVDRYVPWIEDTMEGGGGHTDCAITGGDCGSQACFPVADGIYDCLPSSGLAVGADCNPEWDSATPCADGAYCAQMSDEPTDGECMRFCRVAGDCTGGDTCEMVFTDIPDLGLCLETPQACTITGGDCPSGEACWPLAEGGNGCFPSDGLALGQACNSDQEEWTNLPCGDGLICLQVGGLASDGQCFDFCLSETDCPEAEVCDAPIFRDVDDIGFCWCEDRDEDTYCAGGNDCNDENSAINPAAAEACGDGVDNNCNGQTDEACGCTDADGDGTCVEQDCNDGDAAIHPGATEVCGDGVDNNCDGQTDEAGCCVDGDMDGSCQGVDCNDADPTVHPGASEACADGVDNNCDGQIDEATCCTDGDHDGACVEVDCNDANAAVRPGAQEICDDGIDNDCDGLADQADVDAGCDDDDDDDGRGCNCSAASGSRSGATALALVLLGVFLRPRR